MRLREPRQLTPRIARPQRARLGRFVPHALRAEPSAMIAKHLPAFHAPLKVVRRIGEAAFWHSRSDMLMGTI